jgi:predicted nucleic acid-binding protein
MKIFIDEMAWLALSDKNDSLHHKMKDLFQHYLESGDNFYTTNIIVSNVVSKIKENEGAERAYQFYRILEDAWLGTHLRFLWIGRRTQRDAVKLFKKFPENQMSLFDFANVVLMNRRNIKFIMTTNTNYDQMGFKVVPEN